MGTVPGATSVVDETLWNTSHAIEILKNLRERYQEHGLFVFKEIESSGKSECIQFPVIHFLVVPKEAGQPPPFVRLKTMNGEDPIMSFQELELEWRPTSETDIYSLTYGGRERRHWSESKQGMYKRAILLDCRASKAFKTDDHQRLEVDFAHFTYKIPGGAVVEDTYTKCGALASFISVFCEEHRLDEADHDEPIRQAIKDGFTSKRALLQKEMELVHKGRNAGMLEDIVCGKIYPMNLEEGIAKATQKHKAALQDARAKDLENKKGSSFKLDNAHDQRHQSSTHHQNYTPIAAPDEMPLRVKKTGHLYGDALDDLIF